MTQLKNVLRDAGVTTVKEEEPKKPPEMQPRPAPLRQRVLVRRIMRDGPTK